MDCKETTREISISTPLADGELCFYRMTGTEELGRPFKYDLELVSDNPNIELHKVLGKSITVKLKLEKAKKSSRYFNGYVSHFRYLGQKSGYHFYHAVLRPWLWFLTRTANCRVFQTKTTPEIIKGICDDYSFSDYDSAQLINTQYYLAHKWDYCVQYRESAFNFVSRIMEQTGVYYYFVHNNNSHTLTLADAISSHQTSGLVLNFSKAGEVYDWLVSQKIQPDALTLEDYTFTMPPGAMRTRLSKNRDVSTPSSDLGLEIYDYLAGYTSLPVASSVGAEFSNQQIELQNAVDLKADEFEAEYARVHAKTLVREVKAGGLFELKNHPRGDQNTEYLTVYTKYELVSNLYRSIATDPEEQNKPVYACEFSAMASGVQQDGSYTYSYRSAATTPKPIVHGPQAAFVIDSNGKFDDPATVNSIVTDNYGRVRVSFPWGYERPNPNYIDSTQTPNELEKINYTSCWISVSQIWAGADWGSMHVPHVGQEVIVEFYEGDPNRPIITGRVYNAVNKPWSKWVDPAEHNEQSSYIKDRFGNYIAFAADGIDEKSIAHKSKWTMKDEVKGNLGNKIDLNAGAKISGFAGAKLDVNLGGAAKVNVGNYNDVLVGLQKKFILGGLNQLLAGYEFKYYKGQKHEKLEKSKSISSKEDQIIKSDEKLCLVGGGNPSIFNANKDGISISVGKDVKEKKAKRTHTIFGKTLTDKQMFESTMVLALSLESFAAVTVAGLAASLPNLLEGEGRKTAAAASLTTTLGLITIVDLIVAYRTNKLITALNSDVPIAVTHKAPDAKIDLDKSGTITIDSQKEVIIQVKEKDKVKTKVTVDNAGVKFEGDGTIDMTNHVVKTSNGKLMIDDNKISVKQFLRHKYLSVG